MGASIRERSHDLSLTQRFGLFGWRRARLLVLIVFGVVQIYLAADDSLTSDEARHLRDGAMFIESGSIVVNPEHPPLVKLMAASLLTPRERAAAIPLLREDPMIADARFAVAVRLEGFRLWRVRLPTVALALAALLAFGALFRSPSGEREFAATLLLAAAIPFLAHSHYVTTDLAPVAFLLLSALTVARRRNGPAAAAAGVLIGLALAAKFAAPLLAIFAVAWVFMQTRAKGLLLATAAALATLWAIEAYASRATTDDQMRELARHAFLEGGLGGPAPPAPKLYRLSTDFIAVNRPLAAYSIGFLSVAHRSSTRQGVDYWAGRLVTGPQPLYPLETLAFKNDLPLLLLAALALFALLRRPVPLRGGPAIALAAGAVYLGTSCRSSLHLGVRHLLVLVVLLAALTLAALEEKRRTLFYVLLTAHAMAAALAFPHFVSARNLIGQVVVGAHRTYDLGDDWGQDLGRLLRKERRPVVYLSVIHYRIPDWQPLFPLWELHPNAQTSYLVDRLAVDLLDAKRSEPLPESARRELSGLEPILKQIEQLLSGRSLRETAEPTLLRLDPRPSG